MPTAALPRTPGAGLAPIMLGKSQTLSGRTNIGAGGPSFGPVRGAGGEFGVVWWEAIPWRFGQARSSPGLNIP